MILKTKLPQPHQHPNLDIQNTLLLKHTAVIF